MPRLNLPNRCPKCLTDTPLQIRGKSSHDTLQIDVICTCGHVFEIFEKHCRVCQRGYDRQGWSALENKGMMDDEKIELRNCVCGNTLAIEVDA